MQRSIISGLILFFSQSQYFIYREIINKTMEELAINRPTPMTPENPKLL
jgi:hypothetical protein